MKIPPLSLWCAALFLLGATRLEAQTAKSQTAKSQVVKPQTVKPRSVKPRAATQTKTATPAEIAAADLSVMANISARELRFDQVGDLKVEFFGAGGENARHEWKSP